MPFVLIGIYLGAMAGIAALNAGSGPLLAFGLFSLFGALSLVGGIVIATICVVRTSYLGDTSGQYAPNSWARQIELPKK